ncbi:MAG: hypothetical protein M1816_000207 [Peltula sp. TS41687]|nr:MAG: hypothetical protein M1816_000207 [Peltula sp. TS41687]
MPSANSVSPKAVVTHANGLPSRPSKIPGPLRFPTLVTLSLVLSSALYSIAARYLFIGDLGSVSRRLTEWWEVGGLVGWKAVELGIGWWSDYDGVDLASLTLLSHLPPLYLLHKFYDIHPTTVMISLAIDMITNYLPFRLLRPLLPAHEPTSHAVSVPNRRILTDLPVTILTSLLAAAIYGVVLYSSYASWLSVHLVSYFDGLKDISAAHSPAFPFLVLSLIPVGYAAREFLFTPFTGSTSDPRDALAPAFDPATATLGETLRYNLWGYSKRSKSIITRTVTLMLVTGLNTWLHTFVTIEGAENYGALGWSAIWVVSSAITGLAFWWVADV